MENELKITATAYGKEISIITSDQADITELMDIFETIALGLTFPKCVVDGGFIDKAREIEEE